VPRVAPLRAAVVGAGLGGLTAAVALHQAGCDVEVYEQAPELTEVGGGINLGPNAARVLYRLGLGHAPGRPGPGSARRRVGEGRRSVARRIALALRVRCHRASEKLIAQLARRAASTSHFDLIVVSSARRTVVTSWKT